MRYNILFFVLCVIISPPHIFLAMDPPHEGVIPLDDIAQEEIAHTEDLQQCIDITHKAINKEYSRYKKAVLKPSSQPLSEKKMFGILKIVDHHQKNDINNIFIQKLMKKNIFFMKTINYFCALASKNVENVTCNTLEIVKNHHHDQPIQQLNKLTLPIKKYVMHVAYNAIQRLYNIVFEGHEDTVEGVDINKPADLAASTSKDGTFRLWKLSTGDHLHIFKEKASYGYVQFNPDGSQLATATVYHHNPEKIRIKIWDTHSKELLYTIYQKNHITMVKFVPDGNSTILCIGERYGLSLYKLQKNIPPLYLGNINQGIKTRMNLLECVKKDNDNCWYITKNSRRLGLCELALNNTQREETFSKIMQTSVYKQLSEYEQTMIKTKIAQKLITYIT